MNKTGSSLSLVRIIYIVTTIFLAALSIYTYGQLKNLIDSFDLVNHTNQVSLSLQKISTAVGDVETNQRNFLLLGDSSCLIKRDLAFNTLTRELGLTNGLIKDNPEQRKNLKILGASINKKLVIMNKMMTEDPAFTMPHNLKSTISDEIQKTESVRQIINEMTMNEMRLLQQRSQKYSHLASTTFFFIVILFIGASIILLVSYVKIDSAYHRAKKLEEITIENVSKLRKTNEALTFSEERYHRMVGEVQDYAIILLSKHGIVENWNKGAENIKGYKAEEIIGKSFFQFYSVEDQASHLPERLLALATENGKASDENWRVRKNGSKFWGSVTITALRDNKSNIIGFVKVTRDLTERKLAEEQIKVKAQQLEIKNIELERINKELQSFAYISSHDLQEPLRKIQTFATLILEKEEKNLSEKGKVNFKGMQKSANRMQTLIRDLLAYSRAKIADHHFETIGLKEIIDEVREDLKEEINGKHATIEATKLCDVNVIPFQFRQLMHNLIENSLKFSKPDNPPHIKIESKIEVGAKLNNDTLSAEKKYCHISVVDNGIGFEQQYKEKIFEVFQRLHGRTEYLGTGIGLAIVKKITENHKGFITTSGEIDKGARFDIYIPSPEGT